MPVDAQDLLVETGFDAVVLDGAAVVFQGLDAGGLAAGDGHRDVADFHALGRGEEIHVDRIVEKRVAQAALVDYEGTHAGALGLDGAGEAGGAGPDADHVVSILDGHGTNLAKTPASFKTLFAPRGARPA